MPGATGRSPWQQRMRLRAAARARRPLARGDLFVGARDGALGPLFPCKCLWRKKNAGIQGHRPGAAKRGGKSHEASFIPASFGLYSRAVWKFKAKEVFAAQSIGDPVHIFAGKLSRFHPLVKGRRTCSHGTGKFRLAHTFIGQSHFYFLRYGHCYHLKRIIQIFLVAVKKIRKFVCKRRAVLS